jgi:uncharacterized protein
MKSKIEIKKSGIKDAGRGVFATKAIKKGELIETCPIVIFSDEDFPLLEKTKIGGYVFGYTGNSTMLALGYGSLYNHQNKNNAKYELFESETGHEEDHELCITALKDIAKGEEIYINYGGEYETMYAPEKK